jgi:hypothetical protein
VNRELFQFKQLTVIVLMACAGCCFEARAQEMFGISNSNFAGNMGMGLNPSLFVGSPYLKEFNIISGDLFIDNDYVYLKRRSSFIINSLQGESIPEERVLDYYDSRTKNAYGNVFLRGPSYIKNNDNFSWGVHTALRWGMSATDVPFHVAKFIKDGFDYSPQHDIRYVSTPFRSATMLWGELGGTYGRKLMEERNKKYLAGAITIKLIAGFDGATAILNDFDYMVPSSDTLIVYNATGEYTHAVADGDKTLEKPFAFRGYGAGVDIGFTYYRGKVHGAGDCNETAENLKKYKYRLGFSIIDLGLVMFNKQTKVFSFDNASTVWPGIDTTKFNSISAMDTNISYHFFGLPYESQTGNKVSIYLPTALSMQFDYCVMPRFYANLSIVQAVPLSKYAIVRASQISVTPRYETRNFEVALPFTFYEYTTPHLGLAFRYRFFVLGTDRLGSFTGLWNTTGYDVYFGIKFNVCQLKSQGGKTPFCPVN